MARRWNTNSAAWMRWVTIVAAVLLITVGLGGCPLQNADDPSNTDGTTDDGTGKPADGTDGTNGTNGTDGQDGVNGTNGQDGQNGTNGVDGKDGVDGTNGVDGQDGADGLNGVSCWDLNANGIGDPEEDFNGDGNYNAYDCQNLPGPQGLPCWDLDGDGIGDPEEDFNGDGNYDALDCRGIDGEDGATGPQGIPGEDGADGQNGDDGADGIDCWDLNGNGIGDASEDTNGDGVVDVLDCKYGAAFAGVGLVQNGDFLDLDFDLLNNEYWRIGGNESTDTLTIGTLTNAAVEMIADGVRALSAKPDGSIALGANAGALHAGSFVWADSLAEPYDSQKADEFRVRASGGFYFQHGAHQIYIYDHYNRLITTSAGGFLSTGGSWVSSSDRNRKSNITPVNEMSILQKLDTLPISTWNYNSEDGTVLHLGPMAQDFYGAFGLGYGDTSIAAVDADGVSMAAVKAVYELNKAQAATIAQQEQRMQAMQAQIADLLQRVEALEGGD